MLETGGGLLAALLGTGGSVAEAEAGEESPAELIDRMERAVASIEQLSATPYEALTVDIRRYGMNEIESELDAVDASDVADIGRLYSLLAAADDLNDRAAEAVLEGRTEDAAHLLNATETLLREFRTAAETGVDDPSVLDAIRDRTTEIIDARADPVAYVLAPWNSREVIRRVEAMYTYLEVQLRIDEHVDTLRSAAAGLDEAGFAVAVDRNDGSITVERGEEHVRIRMRPWTWVAVVAAVATAVFVYAYALPGVPAAVSTIVNASVVAIGIVGSILALNGLAGRSGGWDELLEALAGIFEPGVSYLVGDVAISPLSHVRDVFYEPIDGVEARDVGDLPSGAREAVRGSTVAFVEWLDEMDLLGVPPRSVEEALVHLAEDVLADRDLDGGGRMIDGFEYASRAEFDANWSGQTDRFTLGQDWVYEGTYSLWMDTREYDSGELWTYPGDGLDYLPERGDEIVYYLRLNGSSSTLRDTIRHRVRFAIGGAGGDDYYDVVLAPRDRLHYVAESTESGGYVTPVSAETEFVPAATPIRGEIRWARDAIRARYVDDDTGEEIAPWLEMTPTEHTDGSGNTAASGGYGIKIDAHATNEHVYTDYHHVR